MLNQRNEFQQQVTQHMPHRREARTLLFIAILILMLITACGPIANSTNQADVRPPLPTSTLEPTFTRSPNLADASTRLPSTTIEPSSTPLPLASLSGRILDQETGQPIVEAQVSVGSTTGTTDNEGRYDLVNLSPGQYVLSVTHPDFDPSLSGIVAISSGREHSQDLTLYAPDTSPYPQDPMLTNPLDPNGAPTKEDAERLAREQGLAAQVVSIKETRLTGEYLVNYKIRGEVRAAVAEIDHEAWELTDETGQKWWIIKVCGNLASPLPDQAPIATPAPRPLLPLAEVVVDELVVRSCASEECSELDTVQREEQVEVIGCTDDGSWCEVGWPGGQGWCTGQSLRQLAVAEAVPIVQPTLKSSAGTTGEKIAFVSDRDGNDEIYVMNIDGTGLRRLTNHPDEDRYPAWSPDGKQIAFSRDGIYVMAPNGDTQTRLTEFGGCPAWSPDGWLIAFSHSSELYVMNKDGSELTRLGTNINCPTWLPDGKHIAYFLNGTWILRIDTNGPPQIVEGAGPTSYALVDNKIGYIRAQASLPDTNSATWSLDGQRIAFESFGRDRDFEIYTANSDGGELARLTDSSGRDTSPTWSPDAQRIAFTSERDGNDEIYVINSDGSGLMRLTEHPGDDRYPDWSPSAIEIASPNGEIILPTATPVSVARQGKIVFTCTMLDYQVNEDGTVVTHPADGSRVYDEKKEICLINADGSGLTRLTYHNKRNYARDPAWSLDKNKIAFSDDDDIYVMNSDGSDLVNLTNSPDNYDSTPIWSPDGQKIAFCSGLKNVGGNGKLYVMDADGSDQTVLLDRCGFNPEWSPDGTKIAFGNSSIYVVNISDGSLTELIKETGTSPSWSPDGQKIVYANAGSPSSKFFVINADGSGLTQLTDFPASEYWPNWSPDGQFIVFHSNRHGTGSRFGLYIMNADGSGVTRLTEPQEFNGELTQFIDASYPDW